MRTGSVCAVRKDQHFPVFGAPPPPALRMLRTASPQGANEAQNGLATDAGTGRGMDRRRFVAMIGSALAAPRAFAQQPSCQVLSRRISRESPSLPATCARSSGSARGPARPGLRRGQEHRHRIPLGRGQARRGCARSLQSCVALKVDADRHPCASGSNRARLRQTSMIPIVMADGGDPVAVGLAVSVARPGRQCDRIVLVSSFEEHRQASSAA